MAAKAESLRRDLALDALLVTRAEEGMSLFSATGALTIPAQSREVFDVSGAGDTVIATLGVMMAAGASLPEAVRVANEAAGVVVGKFGTAVVHPNELG
jgi:rfaE bifunctional protein kinase chain/domain